MLVLQRFEGPRWGGGQQRGGFGAVAGGVSHLPARQPQAKCKADGGSQRLPGDKG